MTTPPDDDYVQPVELTLDEKIQKAVERTSIDTTQTYYVYRIDDSDFANLGNEAIMAKEFIALLGSAYDLDAHNANVAQLLNDAKGEDGVIPDGSEPTLPDFPSFSYPEFFEVEGNTYFITDIDTDDSKFTQVIDGSVA